MKRNNKTLACLLAGVTAAIQTASAITADNPYTSVITNRNLFSLKAPPLPIDPKDSLPAPVLPKVLFAGISTVGGKHAILRVPVPARPPLLAREVSMIKCEGDPLEEGIQVLEIDVAAARVKISNNGTLQTLDLSKDAPKSAPVAPPANSLPVIAPPRPLAGVTPALPVAPSPFTTRQVRAPGSGPDPSANNSAPGSSGAPGSPAQPVQTLSLEDQTIMIEANRMRTQHLVDQGELPPLPPTDLTDILKQEQEEANKSKQ